MFVAAHDGDRDQAARQLQRGLDGLFEPLRDAGFEQQAVDDDFDGVVLAAVERDGLVEIYSSPSMRART